MPHPVSAFQSPGPLNTRDRSLLNEHRRQIIAGAAQRGPPSLSGTYKLPAFFTCGPSTGAINLGICLQYPFKGGHLNLMIIHLFT